MQSQKNEDYLLLVAIAGIALICLAIIPSYITPVSNNQNAPCTFNLSQSEGIINVSSCWGAGTLETSSDFYTALSYTLGVCLNGCQIHLDNGTWQLSSPVSSSLNNVTFTGSGCSTEITTTANFSSIPIKILGNNWQISNFCVNGANMKSTGQNAEINLRGTGNTITGVHFTQGDFGGLTIQGSYNIATGNYFFNTTDDGIIILNAQSDIIQSNIINITQNHNGISCVSCSNTLITGNTILNVKQYGIGIEGSSSTGTSGITSTNDTLSYNTINGASRGITLYNNIARIISLSHNSISDISGAGFGQGIYVANNNSDITDNGDVVNSPNVCFQALGSSKDIQNLRIYDLSCEGMSGVNGIYLNQVANGTIAGSYLNALTVTGGSAIRLISVSGFLITGNNVARYYNGIYEDTGSDYNFITGNYLYYVTHTKIIITGTHTNSTNNYGV